MPGHSDAGPQLTEEDIHCTRSILERATGKAYMYHTFVAMAALPQYSCTVSACIVPACTVPACTVPVMFYLVAIGFPNYTLTRPCTTVAQLYRYSLK